MPKLKTIITVVIVIIVAVVAIGILSLKPVEEPPETPEQETSTGGESQKPEESEPVATRASKVWIRNISTFPCDASMRRRFPCD